MEQRFARLCEKNKNKQFLIQIVSFLDLSSIDPILFLAMADKDKPGEHSYRDFPGIVHSHLHYQWRPPPSRL